jgi:hypothetical protein
MTEQERILVLEKKINALYHSHEDLKALFKKSVWVIITLLILVTMGWLIGISYYISLA